MVGAQSYGRLSRAVVRAFTAADCSWDDLHALDIDGLSVLWQAPALRSPNLLEGRAPEEHIELAMTVDPAKLEQMWFQLITDLRTGRVKPTTGAYLNLDRHVQLRAVRKKFFLSTPRLSGELLDAETMATLCVEIAEMARSFFKHAEVLESHDTFVVVVDGYKFGVEQGQPAQLGVDWEEPYTGSIKTLLTSLRGEVRATPVKDLLDKLMVYIDQHYDKFDEPEGVKDALRLMKYVFPAQADSKLWDDFANQVWAEKVRRRRSKQPPPQEILAQALDFAAAYMSNPLNQDPDALVELHKLLCPASMTSKLFVEHFGNLYRTPRRVYNAMGRLTLSRKILHVKEKLCKRVLDR